MDKKEIEMIEKSSREFLNLYIRVPEMLREQFKNIMLGFMSGVIFGISMADKISVTDREKKK